MSRSLGWHQGLCDFYIGYEFGKFDRLLGFFLLIEDKLVNSGGHDVGL